jgi:mono/diheme cytochrome c family protein
MREWIARGVVALTFTVVVGLAWMFAARHNPEPRAPARPQIAPVRQPEPPPSPAGDTTPGRAVFGAQGCESCHSIAGRGNPRYPLDDVGARRTPAELRRWILGEGAAAAELPASVQRRKQRYRALPETELAALIAYLSSLRDAERKGRP